MWYEKLLALKSVDAEKKSVRSIASSQSLGTTFYAIEFLRVQQIAAEIKNSCTTQNVTEINLALTKLLKNKCNIGLLYVRTLAGSSVIMNKQIKSNIRSLIFQKWLITLRLFVSLLTKVEIKRKVGHQLDSYIGQYANYPVNLPND